LVVIRGKGWVYEELLRRGMEPILMDCKGSFNWRYLLQLARLVSREGVDLIQSHLLGSNVYCSLAGLLTRTPVVATFHGSVDIGEHERLKSLKFAAINHGASSVVAVSAGLSDDITERTSLNHRKIQVIYNGINTRAFVKPRSDGVRERFGWTANEIIVGSLGNVRTAKGYDVLLRAAAILKGFPHPVRFVIAGQPDKAGLYESLLSLRKELELEETVQFLGFIDDPADFLSGLDLFLSSSISEGLPLSAIQAMVAKLPIVATSCGGWKELINNRETGLLVDVGSPDAIAEGIQLLVADEDLQAALAEGASKYAISTFDISAMLDRYERTYRSLTDV